MPGTKTYFEKQFLIDHFLSTNLDSFFNFCKVNLLSLRRSKLLLASLGKG